MVDEKLIERAQGLLAFLSEVDAYEHLVGEGTDQGSAFLAVKAARLAPILPIRPSHANVQRASGG
jgi:hypothetical protein